MYFLYFEMAKLKSLDLRPKVLYGYGKGLIFFPPFLKNSEDTHILHYQF